MRVSSSVCTNQFSAPSPYWLRPASPSSAIRHQSSSAMRVSVVVEQGWDPTSIEVGPAGGVDWSRAVAVPVPGSLEALELALGLGEARVLGHGLATVEDLLRTCLALGAAGVARAPDLFAVAAALRSEAPDLVLTAHRSADHGAGVTGPMLAGLLDLPQATAAESLRVEGGEAVAVRRLD